MCCMQAATIVATLPRSRCSGVAPIMVGYWAVEKLVGCVVEVVGLAWMVLV
jgi:hypothetical protein